MEEAENQKFYLTKEGLKKLKKEYEDLKKIRMAKTKGEAPNILESEDINPDYLSFKEDIDLLENRLEELDIALRNCQIIKKPKGQSAQFVDLGATVDVEINGNRNEFTLVGTFEANPELGKISKESPVGRALIGHKAGDEIEISYPSKARYKIKKVRYI